MRREGVSEDMEQATTVVTHEETVAKERQRNRSREQARTRRRTNKGDLSIVAAAAATSAREENGRKQSERRGLRGDFGEAARGVGVVDDGEPLLRDRGSRRRRDDGSSLLGSGGVGEFADEVGVEGLEPGEDALELVFGGEEGAAEVEGAFLLAEAVAGDDDEAGGFEEAHGVEGVGRETFTTCGVDGLRRERDAGEDVEGALGARTRHAGQGVESVGEHGRAAHQTREDGVPFFLVAPALRL
mmetsp:Transcript_30329/g.92765  ORF Transcript_30329/g.92765 Transcript_30329/m.92765 type:complete len:243 (-) Transcript_30329:1145-1873(-)